MSPIICLFLMLLDLTVHFCYHRNYISSKWYGFTDPQSGIDKFSWRVGTKPGSDDILKSASLPVSDILVEPDLLHKLPIGKRIYVTIKAYNRAGKGCFFFHQFKGK